MKILLWFCLLLAISFNYKPVSSSALNILPTLSKIIYTLDPNLPVPPTFTEMASLYGHPAEPHEVMTEDGYILTLYRIPGKRQALPVLLFHGILDSSDTWIIRGNTSLGITLANKDYDVWFGNVRGNRYSRRHMFLSPNKDKEFWDFSFNEHGLFDLAATIDYILKETGAKKLNMFGHSQGNAMIWVLLSTRTEYNDKINVATALAPICYMKHVLPPTSQLVHILPPLHGLLQALGFTNVLGDDSIATFAFRVLSRIPVFGYLIATFGILFPAFGTDIMELEPSFIPTVALHVPTWTSIKDLTHFSQLALSGKFARFDYGEVGNLLAYNTSIPPAYELHRITAKVVLLAARNDNLSQLIDVDQLRRQLPNVVRYVINPRLVMNHIDYTWGRNAPLYLYDYIFEVLEYHK